VAALNCIRSNPQDWSRSQCCHVRRRFRLDVATVHAGFTGGQRDRASLILPEHRLLDFRRALNFQNHGREMDRGLGGKRNGQAIGTHLESSFFLPQPSRKIALADVVF